MAGLKRRGRWFYLTHYVGSSRRCIALDTDVLQIAKQRKRDFETAQLNGAPSPLPTRTPIPEILEGYAESMRGRKTAKSAQTDIYYLREMFGQVSEALRTNSLRRGARKRPEKEAVEQQDRRRRALTIEAPCFEQITTPQITAFIAGHVQSRGLAPKTANRYREILSALFNWAITQRGIRMPGNVNPVRAVAKYRERAPEISFLTMKQIDEQLEALRFKPQLQAMVAMLIYAGMRREEILWLTLEDIDFASKAYGVIRVRAKTVNSQSWQPKTKVNRAIPISSTLRAFLDKYRPPKSDHNWFFPSPWGTRWDPDNFSQDLRAANKEANLRWACLDYRHTFGTTLAMNGESLVKISALMGNSPEICRRHYAAIFPEDMTDSVEFVRSKPHLRLADEDAA